MKLRDSYDSLDTLCEDLNVSLDFLVDKLKAAGYDFDTTNNRFF